MAVSKMTMLLDLSAKLFGGKLQKLQSKFDKFATKSGIKLDKLSLKFKGLFDQMPKLGMAIDLFKNPLALATAGIMGLGIAFGGLSSKGIEAAEKFDTAFLPIKQLNLDKSIEQLEGYRSKIRDAAFDIGTNLSDSTNAMYDLQSATGLYGKDAIDIFKKVGRYSQATGADLGDSMNSTTKAMKAFGIGVGGIDALLTSNAKTVQTAIVTFDELAKVQTEYAGATSAAGQSVDIGNKVFAMFTSINKNADIAAGQTKNFFDGLGAQGSKIKKELNIDIFGVDGKMKDADKLLLNISQKFKNMTDKEITGVINKIGGPEGLRTALAKVKIGAQDMIKTFNDFDSSKFNLSDALKNAEGDFGKMKEMFSNRLEMVFSKIGDKIIPILANFLGYFVGVLNSIYKNFNTIETVFDALIIGVGTYIGLLGVLKMQSLLAAAGSVTLSGALGFVKLGLYAIQTAIYSIPIVGWIALAVTGFVVLYQKVDKFRAFIQGLVGIVKGVLTTIGDGFKALGTIIAGAFTLDLEKMKQGGFMLEGVLNPSKQAIKLGSAFDKAYNSEMDKSKKKTDENTKTDLYGNPIKPVGNTDPKNILTKQVTKVVGDAKQTRNISITIDALNKGGINLKGGATQGMTLQDVENWFNEAMMRVVRNAETS